HSLFLCVFSLVSFLAAMRRSQGLLVTDIKVPHIVDFRDNATLSCSYDISGHTLNSVKWYKNDSEFFRYAPLMQTVFREFPVQGVQLIDDSNECNESSCRVELNLLGVKSSGVYRCEVSGDAPHFKLTARSANMSVEALPQNNPLISSFRSMYRFDDFVQVNCSTDFSSLLTKITWFINGVQASLVDLEPVVETTIAAHDYNLRRIISQLNFYANDPRFHTLRLTEQLQKVSAPSRLGLDLRCLAEIESYPELKRETSLQAVLFRDDIDLKNQKSFKSGETAITAMWRCAATAAAAAISTQWLFLPLTFQYGGRKLTRYKMATA
ncbi:hypothetical protein KR044_011676, partial [Drosophila immigrans]